MNIYSNIRLSFSDSVVVYAGTGFSLFNAMRRSKGDLSLIVKYLILELVTIDGRKISEDELDQMPIADASYLMQVVGAQIENK